MLYVQKRIIVMLLALAALLILALSASASETDESPDASPENGMALEAAPDPPAAPENGIAAETAPSLDLAPELTPEPETAQSAPPDTPKPTATHPPAVDGISISASASPGSRVSPGKIEVTINVSNSSSGSRADDLTVFFEGGQAVSAAQSLDPGGSVALRHTFDITRVQLDAGGVTYSASYSLEKGTSSEIKGSKSARAQVTAIEAKPSLALGRSLSATYVESGGTLKVTYSVENTGNVALTGVSVKDDLFGGTVLSASSLEVGGSKTVVKEIKVFDRMVSQPRAVYGYEGSEEKRSVSRKQAAINVARPEVELELTADLNSVSPGDSVTLTMKLTNTGNVTINGLTVDDINLGRVSIMSEPLKPGSVFAVTRVLPLKATTTFQGTMTGISSTGSEISAISNELTVFVLPVASNVRLSIYATPLSENVQPGRRAAIDLTIANSGHMELRGIQVFESGRGDIRTISSLPAGESRKISLGYGVSDGDTFLFGATVTDINGESITIYSDPVTISVLTDEAVMLLGDGPALPEDSEADVAVRRWSMPALAGAVGLLMSLIIIYFFSGTALRRRRRERRRGE